MRGGGSGAEINFLCVLSTARSDFGWPMTRATLDTDPEIPTDPVEYRIRFKVMVLSSKALNIRD